MEEEVEGGAPAPVPLAPPLPALMYVGFGEVEVRMALTNAPGAETGRALVAAEEAEARVGWTKGKCFSFACAAASAAAALDAPSAASALSLSRRLRSFSRTKKNAKCGSASRAASMALATSTLAAMAAVSS